MTPSPMNAPEGEGTEPVDRNRKSAPDGPADDTGKPLGRDEKVSGYPLSFEDVVRAMHRTPRVAGKTLPKRKPGKDPDSK